jgi:hypothetical protein
MTGNAPTLRLRERSGTNVLFSLGGRSAASQEEASTTSWKEPRRYLWLLAAAVPTFVYVSWLGVQLTGLGVFWWIGPILAFGLIPIADHLIGPDSDNPPDSVLAWLETDKFYRWATYLYLPNQYLSLVFACWLWAGGGWVTMDFTDKLGLLAMVSLTGGLAINVAHDLGHTREEHERRLSKIALAQTCYGHFFVEHNRGHHVRVATSEDPASARFGESIYAFIPRSVVGGFCSAWRLEATRLARMDRSPWTFSNDVLNAWALSISLFLILRFGFGPLCCLGLSSRRSSDSVYWKQSTTLNITGCGGKSCRTVATNECCRRIAGTAAPSSPTSCSSNCSGTRTTTPIPCAAIRRSVTSMRHRNFRAGTAPCCCWRSSRRCGDT